jgi:Flp pilus assembly CpaE family ATPase
MEVAKESYEVIVVDTSPFFHGPMLATLDQSDDLLLVCGLDVPTIKNVRLSLQTLQLLSVPGRARPGRPQQGELERRHEEGRGRGGPRDEDPLRGAERPRRSARGQPVEPGRALDPKSDFGRAVREMAKTSCPRRPPRTESGRFLGKNGS